VQTKLFAKEHFNTKDLVVFDIIIIKYCNENGFVPKLDMHIDGGSSIKYTLDYQYKANIDWPVIVEDNQFDLDDNDMVTFIGSKQKHGRNNREFKKYKSYFKRILLW
jgi:tricorn protease-like protein